jgi:phospholipid/cholesterol/gamma-HCH transport system substrate-binding protein
MPSAERVHWAKVRVAGVCVAALLILGTLMILLTGGTLFEPKSNIYLYMPDAVGLIATAPVRVDGIAVGKVKVVELTGSNSQDRVVKVTMIIERDRLSSIPVDSTAQASADTLVGDKFVDITSGKSQLRLQPGGTVVYKAAPDMMKRLDVSQFQENLRQMDAMLTDIEAGKSDVGRLIKGDEVYQAAKRRVKELQDGLHSVRNTSDQLGQSLYTDTLYRQVESQIRGVDQSLAKIQSGQGAFGQLLRDDAQYMQVRDSVAQLHQTVKDLHSQDFFQSDQQYSDWNTSVQRMIRTVDEFNTDPMMLGTGTYESLAGMAKEMEAQMKDFRENPKKYLRLKVF